MSRFEGSGLCFDHSIHQHKEKLKGLANSQCSYKASLIMTLLSNNCISQLLGTANSSDYLASFYCLLVDAPLYNMVTAIDY